jgi:hypothetical protein
MTIRVMVSDDMPPPSNLYHLPYATSEEYAMQSDDVSLCYRADTDDLLKYVESISAEMSRLCAHSNLNVLAYFFDMAHLEASEKRKSIQKKTL